MPKITDNDLIQNPATRCPVCIVVDASGSMAGLPGASPRPIDELNKGLNELLSEIKKDPVARSSADISVVAFGGGVRVTPFMMVDEFPVFQLPAEGTTPLGEAVLGSLEMLHKRKAQFQAQGIEYYQPWMVLMSDGIPNKDSPWREAAAKVAALAAADKLCVYPIAIGEHADLDMLGEFTPGQDPYLLNGLDFTSFFRWLSQSIAIVSAGAAGQRKRLEPPRTALRRGS